MGKGNRQRKYPRGPHIPGQEVAGQPQVAQSQVVVTAQQVVATGQQSLQVTGGVDGQHRQMLLFRGLEAEMRQTMVFAQRVEQFMEQDPETGAKIIAYLAERRKEDEEKAVAAESPIVKPNGEEVAVVEGSKARG